MKGVKEQVEVSLWRMDLVVELWFSQKIILMAVVIVMELMAALERMLLYLYLCITVRGVKFHDEWLL